MSVKPRENAECRMQNAECSEGGLPAEALSEVEGAKAGRQTERRTKNEEQRTRNGAQETLRAPRSSEEESEYAPRATLNASRILRAARNYVWSVSTPWNAERTIVIKKFKPRSIFRRLLDYGKPNKALRSWNGAQELLRRGLHTPTPLACLIPEKTAPGAASYYICTAFTLAWSARDAFTAFSAGATTFQGQAANDLYEAIAVFLQKLHTRGVFFRDLSAGNLIVRSVSASHPPSSVVCPSSSVLPHPPAGKLEFALIDTARARFYPHSLGLRMRLCDLMRICHPLFWPGRRVFVEQYLAHNGRRFSWWMKFPFWYYDGKHRVKNALKKIRL